MLAIVRKSLLTDSANFAILKCMVPYVEIAKSPKKTMADLEMAAVPTKSITTVL